MKKISMFLAVILLTLWAGISAFSAQLFYLSTEKTFSPSETKRVKIESGYAVKALQMRVYRIVDPESFFMKQDNFHKPVVGGREFRQDTVDVADGFYNYLKGNTRQWIRNQIPQENRRQSIGVLPELKGSLQEEAVKFSKVLKPLTDKNYQMLQEFTYVLPGFDQNWNYNYLFLNSLEKGMYLVEASYKEQVGYTVLNISDYGFVIKKSSRQLLAYAVKNETGEPLTGVKVTVFDRAKRVLTRLVSNQSGLVSADMGENELFLMGRAEDGTCSFYDPRYYPLSLQDLKVYMTTERPVYRAKDTVYLKGLMRRYENSRYVPENPSSVEVEVVNSRGEIIQTLKPRLSGRGSFDGSFNLPQEAPSGRYLLLATINGKQFEAEFKVEYYQKPEFEVKVTPARSFGISGDSIEAKVEGRYYFGEVLPNAKVTYSLYRTRFEDSAFESADGDEFFLSAQEKFQAQMELLETGEGQLDSKGLLDLQFKTEKNSMAYTYKIEARVFNDAGVGITGSSRVRVVPADLRIGIRAHKFVYLVGEKITVDLAAETYSDQAFSGEFRVRVSSEDEGDSTIFFDEDVKTDAQGRKTIEFQASKPGFLKILVEGEDASGNETSQESFLWVGQEGAGYSYQGGMVRLILDKNAYRMGEKAKLLILSPVSDLPFLFTLEGDGIMDYKVVKLSKNSAMLEIPIKAEHAPNIFATVNFLFQNQHYSNTIKINVPPVHQFLKISVLPVKERYKPGEEGQVTLKVTDQEGNPVKNTELSAGVVDEAIYGISSEIAPDIREFFYSFRRNGVKTWSSIGFRFYGYSQSVSEEIANRLFGSPTGLAAFKNSDQQERKEFKDTIFWAPLLITDERGEVSFKVKFPDNITKWRITTLGITDDTRLGKAQGFITTRLDLFANLTHPVFLDEKDQSVVYATLHNYTQEILQGNAVLKGQNLTVEDSEKSVEIKPGASITLAFPVKPGSLGIAQVFFSIQAGPYQDQIVKQFPVIPHSIAQIWSKNSVFLPNQNEVFFGLPDNLRKETLKVSVGLSYGYTSAVASALPYLVMFPWGCVEQTTSSFLPNLVALKALKELGISLPQMEEKTPQIISTGLSKLYGYQNPDGSWGWFNEGRSDLFMTAYVLYALTLTRQAGFEVNPQIFNRGISTLSSLISSNDTGQTERIFALYVLSLNRRLYPAMLARMQDFNSLADYDLALLILTLQKSGQTEQALKAVQELKSRAQVLGDYAFWGNLKNHTDWRRESVETTAWALRALNAADASSDLLLKGAEWLLTQREGSQWRSTRDTAASVFALSELMGKRAFPDNRKMEILLNGQKTGEILFTRKQLMTRIDMPFSQIQGALSSDNRIQVNGLQDGEKVFASLSLAYFTDKSPIDASSQGISIRRTYHRLEEYQEGGKTLYRIGREMERAEKGKNFVVKLSISAPQAYQYLLVEDFYPAGALPLKDFKTYQIQGLEKNSNLVYSDYRDEKAGFFLSSLSGQSEIYYVMTPVFKGKYRVIPASATLMYFPKIRGNSADQTLDID